YYKGRLPKDRLARTGNTHGSIENINGEWYVFYHRQTRKNEYSRQACAERIEILPDGKIPQVEMTSCGLNGGPLVANGDYPATICCNLTNGSMPHGHCTDMCLPHINNKGEDQIISEVGDGTFIGYKYFNFDDASKIGVEYCSGAQTPNGRLEIRLGMDEDAIAQIEISDTATWKKADTEVKIPNGTYPLYFYYVGEGLIDIKTIYFI
ncbi:MAG: carbohydrate-binding protein, partial [Clostridia bacterium]|nr:carbohydrate-binding protein [Clostridia bacterium]